MPEDNAARAAAEDRVREFMSDFDAQWRVAAPVFEDRASGGTGEAFALWRELMGQTTRAHFTTSSTMNLAGSFGRPAEYGPESERFVRSEMDGGAVYVLTQTTSPLESFHEYVLREQDGQWRIASITGHYGEPTEPFADRVTVGERSAECGPDHPFNEMPAEQALLDETRLFADREVARPDDGETARTRTTLVGTLVTTTGVLSVLDFGYENDDARPLARTVRPGSYPVDRVTAFGRNAAARVRFGDTDPVAWHPASLPGSGHVVGVDAGCVCIVDYAGYAMMSRRAKAALEDRFGTVARPAAMAIPLAGGDVGVALDSGYGDGSYPVYWGVDAQGEPVQLVIDFLVLVDQDDDGVLTTW